MNRGDKEQKSSADKLLSWVLTYGVVLTGFFLIGLSIIGSDEKWPVWLTAFFRDIGLLFAAATGATLLHEKILREEAQKEIIATLKTLLDESVPRLKEIASTTAAVVHRRFCEEPPQMTGLRLLSNVRRNSEDYYRWTLKREPQTLFFAGRSILHRIDADVRRRTGGSAEDSIINCLKEGSKITVLFLDPRTNILERLADEEGEPTDSMLGNIAISLGICQRLVDRLRNEHATLPSRTRLTIRVYDRIPYFAYHKQNEQMIVGFYFLSTEGSSTASYEVIDDNTKKTFEEHFGKIRAEAKSGILLDYNGAHGGSTFNDALFHNLAGFLKTKLDTRKVDQLLAEPAKASSLAASPA